MTQTPTKKPSFFRRLSLSSSSQQPQVTSSPSPTATAKVYRSSPGTGGAGGKRWEDGLVAGPSYDALPPGAAPSHAPPRDHKYHPAPAATARRERESQWEKPIVEHADLPKRASSRQHSNGPRVIDRPLAAALPTSIPNANSTSNNYHAQDARSPTGERHRHPIYPALASPPNSPPKAQSSNRPHTDVRQSYQVPRDLSPPKRYISPPAHHPASHLQSNSNGVPRRTQETLQSSQHSPTRQRISQSPPNRLSRYADAEHLQQFDLGPTSPPVEKPGPRRSSSSSRPIKPTVNGGGRSASYADRPPPSSYNSASQTTTLALTEASAYAKAVSSSLVKPTTPSRDGAASAPPQATTERRVSRPLPRPPSSTSIPSPSRQPSTMHVIATNDGTGRKDTKSRDSLRPNPKIVIPGGEEKAPAVRASFIAFPRSPTLPPLIDPRQSGDKSPSNQWARNVSMPQPPSRSSTLEKTQLPSRSSSVTVQNRRFASDPSTIKSPVFTSPTSITPTQVSAVSPITQFRSLFLERTGPATLVLILSQPEIQSALLPHLSINSFLSLTGSSEVIRKMFSGETVGRWVMREWGIQVDRARGRSWPNLTVWEGFLESLLHDPSTYSTYPGQWHNLLRHLSLSFTLIVLHLRALPAAAFVNSAPLPFEDEYGGPITHMGYSQSVGSLSSLNLPRSRVGSVAGSDAGSIAPGKMPKHERLMEIVMPEPLAAQKTRDIIVEPQIRQANRRGSVSSLASAAGSFSFGRKRSNSTSTNSLPRPESLSLVSPIAAPIASGKASLPPVSYPMAKRYGFKRHGDPLSARSRTFSESSRPGSVFSVSSSPSVALSQWVVNSQSGRPGHGHSPAHAAPPVPGLPSGFPVPPVIGGGSNRASFASSDAGRSSRPSDFGGNSPVQPRFGSPVPVRRDYATPPPRTEPAFDRPPPYTQGRAPILRVFVPLSDKVKRWPSAEGAAVAVAELDKCGASRRLKLGDLVVNTAYRHPKTTEHVLIFVPFIKHLLVPLEYKYNVTGHLPAYVNGFDIPPSYYYPFLPAPQIIHVDLRPYASQALRSLRLAYDRRDVTVASGARMTAKRYLHVAGFEIKQGDPAAPEWFGMVSLEAEGTAEGKAEMIRRFGGGVRGGDNTHGVGEVMGPWEVVREKSMMGTVWLRMVKQLA